MPASAARRRRAASRACRARSAVHHPAVVILELGGNDGLRALPIDQMRANLSRMIDLAKGAGAKVLLLGMRMPPNYGPQYTEQFSAVYADLAREKHVPLVPFFLSDVALHPDLMQADGVHPDEAASRSCSPPCGRRWSRCSSARGTRGLPGTEPGMLYSGSVRYRSGSRVITFMRKLRVVVRGRARHKSLPCTDTWESSTTFSGNSEMPTSCSSSADWHMKLCAGE